MIMDELNKSDFSLIVFDLDDTLTESKSSLDPEMAELLGALLKIKLVAVTSGASLAQFQQQFLAQLAKVTPNLENLYLLPTSGASLYVYQTATKDWQAVYHEELSTEDKEKIKSALIKVFIESEFSSGELSQSDKEKIKSTIAQVLIKTEFSSQAGDYGQILEDRDSQITFSALGQTAPIGLKISWDPGQQKRREIADGLQKLLPEFLVKIGGSTSIDITKRGIDKAYGLRRLTNYLKLSLDQVLYVGDALFPGGNDEPLLGLGVTCQSVDSITATKDLIRQLIANTG